MNTEQVVEMYKKHKAYMTAYNKRPDVRAKRREYNRERWQLIKEVTRQLKEEGLL